MTGHVPLFPEWAYGLFQSKGSLQDAGRDSLHRRRISLAPHPHGSPSCRTGIWWKEGGKGDPVFNSGYTDVPAELKTLHDEHVHAMISAWALMDSTAENFKQMVQKGFEIPGTQALRSHQSRCRAISSGTSLSASSSPRAGMHSGSTAPSPKRRGRIAATLSLRDKQLAHRQRPGVHQYLSPASTPATLPQRLEADRLRQARLPSHAFGLHGPAAQRRHGLVRRRLQQLVGAAPPGSRRPQLRALRLSLLDHRHRRLPSAELCANRSRRPTRSSTRAGSSTAHSAPSSAPTAIATTTSCGLTTRSFPRLLAVDRLRYRLMPYVYSLAWKVTSDDYTIQRPLVMDFREDPATWEIGDQFMFGPDFLVSPVLTEHATSRSLYLPAGASWYDFWTGERTAGGATITAPAPLDRIPLACARGIDPAARPGDRIRRPGHRPHRAAHLPRRRCRLHALRRRGRQLSLSSRARTPPSPSTGTMQRARSRSARARAATPECLPATPSMW